MNERLGSVRRGQGVVWEPALGEEDFGRRREVGRISVYRVGRLRKQGQDCQTTKRKRAHNSDGGAGGDESSSDLDASRSNRTLRCGRNGREDAKGFRDASTVGTS